MQIEKLIPMTQFVLEETEKSDGNSDVLCAIIFDYAQFLTQPLTLGMFVPTGLNGNVILGKPLSPAKDEDWVRWNNEENEYNEAKSKVLFEGFEWDSVLRATFNKDNGVRADKYILDKSNHTIEFLVSRDIKLTPAAKKQIYGR